MAGTFRASSVDLLREFSVPLIAGVIAALAWANVSSSSYAAFVFSPLWHGITFHSLSNDVFMVLFFGIAAVEITDSVSPGGSLNPIHKALNPLLATVGGIVGPALIYLALNAAFGSRRLRHGWGIPTATDIALAWLAARLVFGKRHPAISFLLLLAVADDAIGLFIIAFFYPDPAHPARLLPLLLVAAAMIVAFALRKSRVNSYWPYLVAGGAPSWVGMYLANLHPALALVFIIPFMPHHRHTKDETVFMAHYEDRTALADFERDWKIVVDFGLFFFGLANAGVEFSSIGVVTWLVLAALIAGKAVGIFGLGLIGCAIGLPLPQGIGKRELLVVGVIAGIGLTVSLFVAGVAFVEPEIEAAAKMGALFSAVAGVLGFAVAKFLRVPRQREEELPPEARRATHLEGSGTI